MGISPVKYNGRCLWLIFCDHTLFSLSGVLKYVKNMFMGQGEALPIKCIVVYPFIYLQLFSRDHHHAYYHPPAKYD